MMSSTYVVRYNGGQLGIMSPTKRQSSLAVWQRPMALSCFCDEVVPVASRTLETVKSLLKLPVCV
jgi:hypothetical protein